MNTMNELHHQNHRMRDAATVATDAVRNFARAANGNNGHIIPAPTAYDLVGNIKILLTDVKEITYHLPSGLAASLNNPWIEVYDRDCLTGEEKQPAEQVAVATRHLRALTTALAAAAEYAEATQSAINSQGYNERKVKS